MKKMMGKLNKKYTEIMWYKTKKMNKEKQYKKKTSNHKKNMNLYECKKKN